MGRRPCCDKVGLKRGGWTASEDEILKAYITANGEGKWRELPKRAGLKRCGKSCRLRWLNYLNPTIKRGNITQEEEDVIVTLHKHVGNRWSFIAARLPGRTDNEIKNYWNTILHKKVEGHHQPSSTPPKRKPRKKSNNQNKSTRIPAVVPPTTVPTPHSSPSQENSTQFMDEMIQNIIDTQAPQCLDDAMTDLGSGNNCAEDIDASLQFLINVDINTLSWDEDIFACQDMSPRLAFSSYDSTFNYWREIFEFGSMDIMSESQQWLCD